MITSRRTLLKLAGAFGAGSLLAPRSALGQATPAPQPPAPLPALPATPTGDAQSMARNSAYWNAVAAQYQVTPEVTNFENGYWGLMARPVLEKHKAYLDQVNQRNSYYARREFGKDMAQVSGAVSRHLNVLPEELLFTRNATEALQTLIGGFNLLKPGDTVLYADVDYDAMQAAMDSLAVRRGVKVVKIAVPQPATYDAALSTYQKALKDNPGTKLLLLTQISHRSGLLLPVKEIAAMARAAGAEVILDAAHSWGQIEVDVQQLGVDFIGFNVHKWIGAPIGVGLMYVKKGRESAIDPDMSEAPTATSLQSRLHTGTTNFAAYLAVPDALAFHQQVGPAAKEARIRYLRDLWVSQVRDLKNLEILTDDDPRMHAGITSIRVKGRTDAAENAKVAAELLEKYKVFTVTRGGLAGGPCIRITPALYTTEADVAQLVKALRGVAG